MQDNHLEINPVPIMTPGCSTSISVFE